MELRALAERILFGTTLEEKLQCPELVTDERPGSPLAVPAAPGRPPGLQFKPEGAARADFPGVHRLEHERERGRLLHFFANHELLATELMALVLLRFPDAPPAFRRGVLQTLKEEQTHTQLYLRRMQAAGIGFGELPVSGFFWRCVAPMENPIDYVATLCLTFEQANLDFAGHFARSFQAVGDADSARLLERIYRDEIRHVAYGLKWFRRWKQPGESDWAAFCRTLKFPLSPQRAKGFTLNVAGRRAAGLDPEFIAELNVYAQSKGRTPNVYVFNPFAEAELARGGAFQPTRHQAQLARDLEALPQFLCRQDDVVLVTRRPSVEFLSGLKQAGFALPEFVELGSSSASAQAGLKRLATRKLGRLRPWAWGSDSARLLAPLSGQVTGEPSAERGQFNESLAPLYSKAWSAEFLRNLLASPPSHPTPAAMEPGDRSPPAGSTEPGLRWGEEPWLCAAPEVGVAVDTLEAAFAAIAAIRRRGHHKVVVKQTLGVAGQNALRLWEPDVLESQRRWLANALRRGAHLVVEPWLERELDFSVQLEMGPQGLKLCGYTGLLNDRRGQFQANWAESHHHKRIPTGVIALFDEPADIASRLHRLYADIFARLEARLAAVGHQGPVSLDAFVYRTPEGTCRLKPVVEINPRYTMGRVLVELMRRTCPGSCGVFRLIGRGQLRAEGTEDFPAYARALCGRDPLRLEGAPEPRIREGTVCLNDPAEVQACLAVFQVRRTLGRITDDQPAPCPAIK